LAAAAVCRRLADLRDRTDVELDDVLSRLSLAPDGSRTRS